MAGALGHGRRSVIVQPRISNARSSKNATGRFSIPSRTAARAAATASISSDFPGGAPLRNAITPEVATLSLAMLVGSDLSSARAKPARIVVVSDRLSMTYPDLRGQ